MCKRSEIDRHMILAPVGLKAIDCFCWTKIIWQGICNSCRQREKRATLIHLLCSDNYKKSIGCRNIIIVKKGNAFMASGESSSIKAMYVTNSSVVISNEVAVSSMMENSKTQLIVAETCPQTHSHYL